MSLQAQRKKPSERNVEIYYAILADEMSRKEAAEKHNITPQRVSKIVRTVAAWILQKGIESTFLPAEQIYLAHDAHLYGLRKFKTLALAAFEQTRAPQIAPDKTATPGKWIPAKPDIRCLAKAMDADKAIVETRIAMAHAQERLQNKQEQERRETVKAERIQASRDRRTREAFREARQEADRLGLTAQLQELCDRGNTSAMQAMAMLQSDGVTPSEDSTSITPPAGAMPEFERTPARGERTGGTRREQTFGSSRVAPSGKASVAAANSPSGAVSPMPKSKTPLGKVG